MVSLELTYRKTLLGNMSFCGWGEIQVGSWEEGPQKADNMGEAVFRIGVLFFEGSRLGVFELQPLKSQPAG